MKLVKNELKKDCVASEGFHVGIELELTAPSTGSDREHDYDACNEDRRSSLEHDGARETLVNYFDLSTAQARQVENYFNFDEWLDNYMDDYTCDGDCGHYSGGNHQDTRAQIAKELIALTGNKSFKVVEDGSIQVSSEEEETDAEVCWNYFASKETLQDNEKIMKYLRNFGCDFDTSCGLHINLNNYLHVPEERIDASELSFLFDFVAPSRRTSSYCSSYGMGRSSHGEKYSMIFNQGDRLEFRFFSPTLEAEKLHHYVVLANTVYKRLAGKKSRLPKKTENYLIEKMVKVHNRTLEQCKETIEQTNTLKSAEHFRAKRLEKEQAALVEYEKRESEREAAREAARQEAQRIRAQAEIGATTNQTQTGWGAWPNWLREDNQEGNIRQVSRADMENLYGVQAVSYTDLERRTMQQREEQGIARLQSEINRVGQQISEQQNRIGQQNVFVGESVGF